MRYELPAVTGDGHRIHRSIDTELYAEVCRARGVRPSGFWLLGLDLKRAERRGEFAQAA